MSRDEIILSKIKKKRYQMVSLICTTQHREIKVSGRRKDKTFTMTIDLVHTAVERKGEGGGQRKGRAQGTVVVDHSGGKTARITEGKN